VNRGRRFFRRPVLVAGSRALLIVALLGAGLMFVLGMSSIPRHDLLFDFKGGLYDAGRQILHGHNPYRPGFLEAQAAVMRAGGIALGETSRNAFSIPVYPAPINLAVIPFSLLPFWLAGVLFTLLSIGAMVLGLRLLGVRDWRCFALALLSWPFAFGLDLGALGPLLVLGAGVLWRWRDRLWPPAIALASIVVAKVFPWPLGIWLLVTRRFRALALAIVIGAVACFAAWAVIGFDGLAQYPQMLSNLAQIEDGRALSLVSVLLALGFSAALAKALALAATAALLSLAWRFARRPGGDAQAFGLAVIAALTSSPIVWEHYMVLLFVPIALVSPRFSKLWLVPVCTPLILVISAAVAPVGSGKGADQQLSLRDAVMWLVLEAIIGYGVCRSGSLKPRLQRTSPSAGRRTLRGSVSGAAVAAPPSGVADPIPV
jgi:hypothetical protein